MPDSINKVCSVQFDIHKYVQHLDSFCRVDGNCKGINRNNYFWLQLSKQPEQKTFLAIHTVSMGWWLSPPQRLLLGIPIKLAIIGKIESARGKMGKGTRQEPLFSLPLPIVPRALSFSFSPASQQYKEASGAVVYCKLPLLTPLPTPPTSPFPSSLNMY